MYSPHPKIDHLTRLGRLPRFGLSTLSLTLMLVVLGGAVKADEGRTLRLCADPTNLPFSSDDPSVPGFYLEIGSELGKAIGRPISYNWYRSYFGKRTVRVTLLAKQCDAIIGLPESKDFMGPAVIFSRPFINESYALVMNNDRSISQIDDLKGLRVAVQYESTPHNLIGPREDVTTVTVLTPEEGMEALDQGRVDVAFIWGPSAGWLNQKKYSSRFKIRPVDGEGLTWSAAIAFARGSSELRDQVDALLPELQPRIAELAKKYGFPSNPTVKFGGAPELKHASAGAGEARTVGQKGGEAAVQSKEEGARSNAVEIGREVFNGTCAHCHGPDAIQAQRRIDLRRLRIRYGEAMRDTFWTTVHEGRPSKGMPAWKEVFNDDQLNDIYSYLLTVQSN